MNEFEKQFKEIVAGLNINDRPNTEHKETLRQQMLTACRDATSKPARRIQPVWSKIMKSNITKTAAAAIILIAAFIFLTQSNGTGLAWADVIEQFSHPYQCMQTVFYGGKEHQRIKLYRLNPSQRREERDNNEVFIVDIRQSPVRTLYLYNNDRFAKVTRDYGRGPLKDPDLLQMLSGMQDGNAEKLGVQMLNGIQAEGFQTANEYNDITIWADIQTGLPVKVEIVHLNHDRKIVFEDFVFDVQFDPLLFSTDPPMEYRVSEYNLNQNTVTEKSGQTDNTQPNETLGDFKPYSCEETVYRDGKKFYTSKLYHKNLSVRREERDNGKILVFDMTEKPIKFLTLKPESMTAELELHYELSPSRDPDILAMLAQMQQGLAEKLGIQEVEGIQAEGFHRVDPYNDVTIWADVKTGLPVKIEILHPKQNQRIVMDNFDFETVLDDSLFLTTPPEGYTLNEKHVGLDLKASAVAKEQLQQASTGYPVYVLKDTLSWTLKPTIVEGNVPGLSDKKLHIIAATSQDGRHVVLCQCSFYKMLKEKIHGGNKCLELNGFTVWNGGPEKWYSQIALESAEGMIPPGISEDRTGYAIETPQEWIIIVGINGAITDAELKELVGALELVTTEAQ